MVLILKSVQIGSLNAFVNEFKRNGIICIFQRFSVKCKPLHKTDFLASLKIWLEKLWISCSGSCETSLTTELESLKNLLSWIFWCLEMLLSLPTKKRLQTWKSILFNLKIGSFLTDDKSFLTNLTRLLLLLI